MERGAETESAFGDVMREWRGARGMSQMDLQQQIDGQS